MKVFRTILEKTDSVLITMAQISMLIMMFLTTADAIMRYVFNSAITGAYYFTENYLMIILVFFSMSYVLKLNGHISIDLFTNRMPDKLVKMFNVVYGFLAAIFIFIIGYQASVMTYSKYVDNHITIGLIAWPTWTSWVWIPIGTFVFSFRLFLNALEILSNFNEEETKHVSE